MYVVIVYIDTSTYSEPSSNELNDTHIRFTVTCHFFFKAIKTFLNLPKALTIHCNYWLSWYSGTVRYSAQVLQLKEVLVQVYGVFIVVSLRRDPNLLKCIITMAVVGLIVMCDVYRHANCVF